LLARQIVKAPRTGRWLGFCLVTLGIDHTGKVVVVTGGARGVGRGIAEAFLATGGDVVVCGRTEPPGDELPSAGGRRAVFLTADVRDAEQAAAVMATTTERFGRLDVLVNSAGIGIAGTVEHLPSKHLDLTFGVNVRGLFLVTQKAIPLLRESRGWIVNLASIAGTMPTPGLSAYGATKAAVISLTRSLNAELDADGIRAVAICPGFVDTPMAEWTGLPGDQMIQPEDCAEVVRMLLRLSPGARIPQVVIERVGSSNGDAPLLGA
jgi:3-oxoacyl-[acyl-carrier protein] reductase